MARNLLNLLSRLEMLNSKKFDPRAVQLVNAAAAAFFLHFSKAAFLFSFYALIGRCESSRAFVFLDEKVC